MRNTCNSFKAVPLRRHIDKTTNGTTATQVEEEESANRVTRIETISNGVVDLAKIGFVRGEENLRQFALREGDVLFSHINSMSVIGNSAIVTEDVLPLYVGMNLLRLRPGVNAFPQFLAWSLKSDFVRHQVRQYAKPAINQASISTANLKRVRAPLPDLATQRQIADFLDRETARIDLLIEKKQRLVALLGDRYERHRDQILSATDDDLPQQSMRWLIRVGSGDFISNEEMSSEQSSDRPIPVIGGNGVMAYTNRSNTPTNTLVVGRVGALCGNVHFFEHRSWVTDNALIVRLTSKEILPRYAFEILKSAKLNEKANKSAQPLITGETVKKVTVRLPPKDEQENRVRRLAELSEKLAETTKSILTSIDRLKEYRSALITASVTGQIDVTTYAKSGTHDRRLDAIQEEMGEL